LREIGPHPEGGTVGLYRGRYGPYVSHDKVYASLPKGADPNTFPIEDALPLLAAQKAKGKGKTRRPVRKAAGAAANGEAKPARPRAAAKRTPATAKAKPPSAKAKGKPAVKKKPAERSASRPT